jgi:hypothetical protein
MQNKKFVRQSKMIKFNAEIKILNVTSFKKLFCILYFQTEQE